MVVEDDFFIADALAESLRDLGALVVGPVPDVDWALSLLSSEPPLDAVILDLDLRGEAAWPIADRLATLGVRFAFCSSLTPSLTPQAHRLRPWLPKPPARRDLERFLAGD